MGRLSTPTCAARICNCSIAAGRLVSRLASSTRLPLRSLSRLASFAVVVVLPDPCRPTISIAAGGLSIFSASAGPSPASTLISSSCTILTTIWPGVTDFVTAAPVALSCTRLMKSRATGRLTSASSSATRTSRRAAMTSASDSAPALVRRSKTPPRRSERDSNMAHSIRFVPRYGAGRRAAQWGAAPAGATRWRMAIPAQAKGPEAACLRGNWGADTPPRGLSQAAGREGAGQGGERAGRPPPPMALRAGMRPCAREVSAVSPARAGASARAPASPATPGLVRAAARAVFRMAGSLLPSVGVPADAPAPCSGFLLECPAMTARLFTDAHKPAARRRDPPAPRP
jgi:hypothetical protein